MPPTREQARAELARRELARRGQATESRPSAMQELPAIMGAVGREVASNFPPGATPMGTMRSMFEQLPQPLKSPFEQEVQSSHGKAAVAGAKTGNFLMGMGTIGRPAAKAVGYQASLLKGKNQVNLARQARTELQQVGVGNKMAYEAGMRQLPGQVDVSEEVSAIQQLAQNPDAKLVLDEALANAKKVGDDTLQQFLANPELAKQATAHQADQVSTTLRQIPTILKRLRPGAGYESGGKTILKTGEHDRAFSDVSGGITRRLESLHPEAYPKITQQYGQTERALETLTPAFQERGNRLFQNIRSGFGGGEVAERVRETLPASTSKKIFDTARNQQVVDFINPLSWAKRFLTKQR